MSQDTIIPTSTEQTRISTTIVAPNSAASSAPGKAPRAPSAGAPMAVAENDKESTSAYGASGGIVRIATGLARHKTDRQRQAVVWEQGRHAVTRVRVVERFGGGAASLVECWLETGRTHQIRVHLASNGHPIAGDDKYGDFEWNKALQKQGLKRMFLHAWRLQFNHPASGERVALQADLPPELAQYVQHVQLPPPSV